MYTRKVRKSGNSRVVSIPSEIHRKMGIKFGEHVIIIQMYSGEMRVFGIGDSDDAYKMMRVEKGRSVLEVKKIMRQVNQMLIGIPVKESKSKSFNIGEDVILEMESKSQLRIKRLV